MWILFLFALIFPTHSHAQETTPISFSQYQSDYLYQYNLYQQTYSKYHEKDQVYDKYQTITAQKEKIATAKDALIARNHTLKSYFLALQSLLEEQKSAHPSETQTLQDNLAQWEQWLDDQTSIISAIDDQESLQTWVTDFKSKYIEIQQLEYSSLVQHEINLRQQTLNQIQSLANDIKNNPQIKPESQQWISTLADKSSLVSQNLSKALTLTQKKQVSTRFSNFYPSAKTELSSAQNYLKEITTDLKLIVSRFYQP